MFLPTHAVVGAVIDKASRRWYLTVPIALLSHPLLDYFNCGPQTLYHGPFEGWGRLVLILVSVMFLTWFLIAARRYWLGAVAACAPDVEWAIFAITGWDESRGLHHKWFWPSVLTTEWGILAQAVLVLVLVLIVFSGGKEGGK